ncbi:glycosyltransferase family 2 protein [Streptococcus pluranimalium]|uniref:glycosyltransferase family 2 protein n=1 Tax=Streptococcus pluranimalium TaxID=82348 RepID=UPI003F66AC8E
MISFIIVNYLNYSVTLDCIDSIYKSIDLPLEEYEILIVDNCSPNDSVKIFKEKYIDKINIFIISNEKNFGFGIANNIGVSHAKGDKLFFVNSDVIFENFNFKEFSDLLTSKKNIGMLSCKILYKDGSIQSVGNEFPNLSNLFKNYVLFSNAKSKKNKQFENYLNRGMVEWGWCSGSFFSCNKENFLNIGGFDENIFLYGEDLELGIKFSESGYKNFVNDEYYVYHLHGSSSKLTKPNYFKLRNNKLNDLYVFKKHNLFNNFLVIRLMLEFNAIVIYFRAIFKYIFKYIFQ